MSLTNWPPVQLMNAWKHNMIGETMSRGTTSNKTTMQVQNSTTPPLFVLDKSYRLPVFNGTCSVSKNLIASLHGVQKFHFSWIRCSGGVALFCFFQALISCTGGQLVSHMLFWQPSDYVHSMVMIMLRCSRKINAMMMLILVVYNWVCTTVQYVVLEANTKSIE